jgi:hypothetical protein
MAQYYLSIMKIQLIQIYYCCGCLQHVLFGDKCVSVLIVLIRVISLGLNIDYWMMIDIFIKNFGGCQIFYSFFIIRFLEICISNYMHFSEYLYLMSL